MIQLWTENKKKKNIKRGLYKSKKQTIWYQLLEIIEMVEAKVRLQTWTNTHHNMRTHSEIADIQNKENHLLKKMLDSTFNRVKTFCLSDNFITVFTIMTRKSRPWRLQRLLLWGGEAMNDHLVQTWGNFLSRLIAWGLFQETELRTGTNRSYSCSLRALHYTRTQTSCQGNQCNFPIQQRWVQPLVKPVTWAIAPSSKHIRQNKGHIINGARIKHTKHSGRACNLPIKIYSSETKRILLVFIIMQILLITL